MEPIQQLPAGCPWSNFSPPTIKYCEENICSWITQPSNTWSNLAYILVGLFLIWRNSKDKNPYLRFVGPVAIATGVASFLYHASFTFLMQFFDLSAMYLFAGLLISMNAVRLRAINREKQLKFFVIIIIISMLQLGIFKKYGIPFFGILVIIAMFTEYSVTLMYSENLNYRDYRSALFFLILAFVCWIVDFRRIICHPENHLIQGHALWHVFSSVCFIFLYNFYGQVNLEE